MNTSVVSALTAGRQGTAAELAVALEADERSVYAILRHLAANERATIVSSDGAPWEWRYGR